MPWRWPIAPRLRHTGEVFCGWGIIFAQCVRLGLASFYYDLDIGGRRHNILTGMGLLFLIQNLLTVMSGGCVWFGIPCSTWVRIARGHTQRPRSWTHQWQHRSPRCLSSKPDGWHHRNAAWLVGFESSHRHRLCGFIRISGITSARSQKCTVQC